MHRFMSKFISRHVNEIPPIVFRLFQYVIAARTAYYDAFQALLAERPDPELEKQAFDVLGGLAW